MRRPITYAEGTKIVNDILGNEVIMMPNGVASTDNGMFNVSVAKSMFFDFILDCLDESCVDVNIKERALEYARDDRHFVLDEWLNEILDSGDPYDFLLNNY